jgi:protein TonB
VEKSAKARSAQPSKQESVAISEHENVQDAGEENASAAAGQQAAAQAAGMGGGGGGAGMVRAAIPLYKVNPPPLYPAAARRRGAQGTVVLSVHVDEHGRVSNLWLFESSGHISLDTAALQAVKDWIFEPGMQGGSTIAMWVNVPVRFELK